MKCPRCGNQDKRYFYQLDGNYYCRKCVNYSRVFVHESLDAKDAETICYDSSYHLKFSLSNKQQEISKQLMNNYQNHKNTVLKAVTGSGKTEITYQTIQYALNQGHRVAFVIPRKELVVELGARIKEAFEHVTISIVYGGHHEDLNGQLVICTCHQLYRYPNCFDLLILDEMDAFA